jgi:hypothetical protein
MKKKLSINWLIFAGIIGSILFLAPYAYGIYLAVTDEPAKVSNLSIGWSQSEPQTENIIIPKYMATIRVCGYLEANRAKPLLIYVLDVNGGYYGVNADGLTQPGEFCSTLKIEAVLFPGKYIIEIHESHSIIATINFEVK